MSGQWKFTFLVPVSCSSLPLFFLFSCCSCGSATSFPWVKLTGMCHNTWGVCYHRTCLHSVTVLPAHLSVAGNQNLSALANRAAVACVLSPRNLLSSAITCWFRHTIHEWMHFVCYWGFTSLTIQQNGTHIILAY